MVTPLVKHKIIKKRTAHFNRHQSDRFKRLGTSWRINRGIDNPVRRRFRGALAKPRIGYGTKTEHKHILPSGFLKFRVSNVADLDVLLMHNRKYAAEVAHNVSAGSRVKILKRAAELNVRVLNAGAKLRTEESA